VSIAIVNGITHIDLGQDMSQKNHSTDQKPGINAKEEDSQEPQEIKIFGRVEMQSGLLSILQRARNSISIFDKDLEDLQLDSAASAEALRQFFQKMPGYCKLYISVHHPHILERRSPRLVELTRCYGNSIELRETMPMARHISDTLVIVDNTHALIRFHFDSPRGKILINDSRSVRPYSLKFEDVWKQSETLPPLYTVSM